MIDLENELQKQGYHDGYYAAPVALPDSEDYMKGYDEGVRWINEILSNHR